MKPWLLRLIDVIALALVIAVLVVSLAGCTKSDTVRDAKTDRTTVVKETKVHEGSEPWKETVYREEVSKEVAHSEQSRTSSVQMPDGLGTFLSSVSTGNPAIDMGLALLTIFFGKKTKDAITKKKEVK